MTASAATAASSPPSVLRSPAFVGRGRELARLTEALARPPAVVLVEGEAGIGKSRLMQELLANPPVGHQPPVSVGSSGRGRALLAVCPPFRQPYTLGPVVDAVRQATGRVDQLRLSSLAGALRPLLPEWSAQLPPSPEPIDDATAVRHRLFRALHEVLDALRVRVLVVEDAHWADDATVEFLLHVVAQRPPRISVVATYRPEDLPGDSLLPRLPARLPAGSTQLRLTLAPLTVADTAALVSSMVDGEVSSSFATFLHEGTDGLPLAVEESVRLMYDRADLALRRSGGWARRHLGEIAIPPTVRDTVLERFRWLGVQAQAVLRAAAVLAEAADTATLAAVSGLATDEVATGRNEALESGLLVEDERGAVGFRHALAGRAVYDQMPTGLRREWHRRAGRVLQGVVQQPVARLARHFREAGEHGEWQHYAEEAADQALASGDDATATVLLYDLVVDTDQTPDALLRLLRRIPVVSLMGHDRMRRIIDRLRSSIDGGNASPAKEAHLRLQLGRMLTSLTEYEAARVELEKALVYPDLDPTDRADALMLLVMRLGSHVPVSVSRQWLLRAGEVLADVGPAQRDGREINRLIGLLVVGDEAGWAAATVLDEAGVVLPPSVHGALDIKLGWQAARWGHLGEARRRFADALALADRHHLSRVREAVLVNVAILDWESGQWAGLAQRARELAENGQQSPEMRMEAAAVAALLRSVASTDPQAGPELSWLLDETRRLGILVSTQPAAMLALLHVADGNVAGALAATDEPMTRVADTGRWIEATDLAPARVMALLVADRLGDAEELVAAFAGGLGERDAPGPQAALKLCRAMLMQARGEHARAAELFARVAAQWAALPRPYDALLARERRGVCLLGAGRPDDALAELSQVFQELTALGALRDADRLRRLLREHHVNPRPAGGLGRPSYGDQLSPREWQVVDLIVEGRTNQQIADALVLSVQTVKVHVKTIMRKLAVPSRVALARRAAELRSTTSAGL